MFCATQNGKSCCDYPSVCGVTEPEPSIESNDFDEPDVNSVEKQQEEENEPKSSGDEEQNISTISRNSGSSSQDESEVDDDEE